MTSAPPAPPGGRRHPRLCVPPSDSHHPNPQFKGVRMRSWGRWVSEIRIPHSREKIWLGSYAMPELAARVYDAAYLLLRGPSAATALNFPDSYLLIYPHLATYMQGSSGGTCMRRTIQIAAAAIAKAIEGAEEHDMESAAMEGEQAGTPGADQEGETERGRCGNVEGQMAVISMESGWISDVVSLVSPRRGSSQAGAGAGATAEYNNRLQGSVNMENILRSASSDDHFLQQALQEALVQDGFTPMSLAVTTRQKFDTDVACSFYPLWSYLS